MSVYQSVSIQEIPTLDALRDCVEKSDAVGFGHTLKTAMKESGHPRGWPRDLLFDIACSKAEPQLRDEMISILLRCSKAPRPTRKDNILDIVIGMGYSRANTTKILFEAGYELIDPEKSIKEVARHLARGNWYSPDLLCPKALEDPLYCSVFREALSGAGFNPRYYENGSGFFRASCIEKFLEWTARELSIDGHSHLSSLFDGVFLEVSQDPYAFSLNPGTPPVATITPGLILLERAGLLNSKDILSKTRVYCNRAIIQDMLLPVVVSFEAKELERHTIQGSALKKPRRM